MLEFKPRARHVPGWFPQADEMLFDLLLAQPESSGDLAEIGVYLGRSAITIGAHCDSAEKFTVVDLFGGGSYGDDNTAENVREYPDLTRGQFEEYYLSVHPELPQVVSGDSTSIVEVAQTGEHRFVHVDASHLYDYVIKDIDSARELLTRNGIVVFDDYRTAHAPGVAAAVWPEVTAGGLQLLAISEQKMYCTWGDPSYARDLLHSWVQSSGLAFEEQSVAGQPVLRLWQFPSLRQRWIAPAPAEGLGWLARRAGKVIGSRSKGRSR